MSFLIKIYASNIELDENMPFHILRCGDKFKLYDQFDRTYFKRDLEITLYKFKNYNKLPILPSRNELKQVITLKYNTKENAYVIPLDFPIGLYHIKINNENDINMAIIFI